MSKAVVFDNVSIVFGSDPKSALPLMDEGKSRSEVQTTTDQVLGVHNCSIEVEEGEILVLMGLSGSGKSTLLRAVNGLNKVVRGSVLINDGTGMTNITTADPAKLREMRLHRVAMVFQQFGLLPWRDVMENVAFGRARFDQFGHAVVLDGIDQRAHVDGFVERVAHAQFRHARLEFGIESLRHGFVDQETRARAADLPLIEPDRIHQTLDRAVEIGIVEDDIGRLATQLQRQRLAGSRRRRADAADRKSVV